MDPGTFLVQGFCTSAIVILMNAPHCDRNLVENLLSRGCVVRGFREWTVVTVVTPEEAKLAKRREKKREITDIVTIPSQDHQNH